MRVTHSRGHDPAAEQALAAAEIGTFEWHTHWTPGPMDVFVPMCAWCAPTGA
jgi:hypothetical protein